MNKLFRRSTLNQSSFPHDLVIRASPRWEIYKEERKTQTYRVEQPFGFKSTEWGMIVVPAGFMTDFASVPTFSKAITDDDSPDLLFPSLPHDYLYKLKGILPTGAKLIRKEADDVLREAMRACGAPESIIFTVYWSVRTFGSGTWNKT